jgi:mRNA-degrading endonuclease RelE of RelBE toxin-antitoxin system
MKQILWRTKALRQLRKIKSQKEKETIYDAVETLGLFPNCANVKKLSDRNDYRLRAGKWRIIFTAAADICIEAAKKGKRSQGTASVLLSGT